MQQAAGQPQTELQVPRHIPPWLSTGMATLTESCLMVDPGRQHRASAGLPLAHNGPVMHHKNTSSGLSLCMATLHRRACLQSMTDLIKVREGSSAVPPSSLLLSELPPAQR